MRGLSSKVISTYTGRFERIMDNPSWMAKSYNLFVSISFIVQYVSVVVNFVENFTYLILHFHYYCLRWKIPSRDLKMLLEQ